jgi:hypothetical protein
MDETTRLLLAGVVATAVGLARVAGGVPLGPNGVLLLQSSGSVIGPVLLPRLLLLDPLDAVDCRLLLLRLLGLGGEMLRRLLGLSREMLLVGDRSDIGRTVLARSLAILARSLAILVRLLALGAGSFAFGAIGLRVGEGRRGRRARQDKGENQLTHGDASSDDLPRTVRHRR